MHKVTEVFVGRAIFEPRQLTLQLNLSALSYREGQKPGTFLGDGICASPSVVGAVRTIWGSELVWVDVVPRAAVEPGSLGWLSSSPCYSFLTCKMGL